MSQQVIINTFVKAPKKRYGILLLCPNTSPDGISPHLSGTVRVLKMI